MQMMTASLDLFFQYLQMMSHHRLLSVKQIGFERS